MKNPELQEMLQLMVEQGVKNALQQRGQNGGANLAAENTPKTSRQTGRNNLPTVKSPSDTTIYAPVIKMIPCQRAVKSIF